jgi:hypothetical protein
MQDYSYQAEKFSTACLYLMLPHVNGVENSIADAFNECSIAFRSMDENGLDNDARTWVSKIKNLMDTTHIHDSTEGRFLVKAHSLTVGEQIDLSRTVKDLAYWFGQASKG